MQTNLNPTNGQKSFYNKAVMIRENNVTRLQSYNTIVATYNHVTNDMKISGYYSQTTAKHINAFLSYFGFDTCNKKQLENY